MKYFLAFIAASIWLNSYAAAQTSPAVKFDYWTPSTALLGAAFACLLGYFQYKKSAHKQQIELLGQEHLAKIAAKDSEIARRDSKIATLNSTIELKDERHQLELIRQEMSALAEQAKTPSISQVAESVISNVELEKLDKSISKRTDVKRIDFETKLEGEPIALMQKILNRLDDLQDSRHLPEENSWREAVAASAFARQDFVAAAQQLEKIAREGGQDWQLHLTRGVAFANQRGGAATDLEALRAYNDAIAVMPGDTDSDTKAKLFTYRGAMLKRLDRLREARADLTMGKELAISSWNKLDANYNLAGVAAQLGEIDEALRYLRELNGHEGYLRAVANHKYDYFAKLAGNPEFEGLVGLVHG
ncbi:hypothetical protein [Rhizobium laguerreae]|uniref:Tetratricopeptide repeat protein n=1 Tax=Rhizobium laguerreae TaxID=1076926 RepID=A0A6N9ZQ45_9HYPH|nr:hypothetical protein [Rhizobium laguerreae]NEH95100.1 hypothetical protein [Rhizobium laguerreae]